MMVTTELNRINEVRQAFPSLNDMTYLNVATHGLTPQPVLERYLEMITLTARYGHMRYTSDDVPAYQRARHAVARILDVPPTTIAFSRNATDGINYVLGSLAWQPNDEVIISNQEHPAVTHPWEYGLRRGLFKGKTVTLDADPAITLRNLEELMTPQTRLIMISSISSQTGIRVPWSAICARVQELNAAGRERPILTLTDGTQELGQWRVSVPTIGCDFYVTNGHKWLGGPKGSGILVVKQEACSELTPPYMAGGIDDVGGGSDRIADVINHFNGALMYESGTQNLAVVSILADAVEWLDALGWDWVEAREQSLAAYLRDQLKTIPGLEMLTPDEWERSSAITSFRIADHNAQDLHKLLWDQRIIQRPVPEMNGIRIATPYFLIEEELDRLIEALRRLPRP